MSKTSRKSRSLKARTISMLWTLIYSVSILLVLSIPGFKRVLVEWDDEIQNVMVELDRPTEIHPDLAFVGFTQESIEYLGKDAARTDEQNEATKIMSTGFPWSRKIYGMGIERLIDAGAKMVIFAPLLDQPSDDEGDQYLAKVIEKHRSKIVLSSFFMEEGDDSVSINEPLVDFLGPLDDETSFGFTNVDPDKGVFNLVKLYTYPSWLVEEAELGAESGVEGEERFYSLASVAAQKMGVDVDRLYLRYRVPLCQPWDAINLYKPYPFFDLFVGEQDLSQFKDKVVVIGAASSVLKEPHDTGRGLVYDPQLHLHILASLLRNDAPIEIDTVRDPNKYWLYGLIGVVIALLVAFFLNQVKWLVGSFVLVVVVWIGFIYGFGHSSYLVGFLPAGLAACAGILGRVSQRVRQDSTQRKSFERQLGRSMSPQVAAAITKAPEGYYDAASGLSLPVTILFSDVRGFTAISESLDASEVIQLMNRYFGEMVDDIFHYSGTVDKFIGDAIMATWGELGNLEPKAQVSLALGAVEKMEASLHELNAQLELEGKPDLRIGIGLHHGIVSVGEIGSEHRTDFTVIGDSVNMASRVESLSSQLGITNVFSKDIVDLADETIKFMFLGAFQLKGKKHAVELYTFRSSVDLPSLEIALRSGKQALLEKELLVDSALREEVALCSFYQKYLSELESESWSGVFVMTSK